LPDSVAEAIKQDFASPASDADLKALNEEFLKKHSQSSEHLRRGYNVRYLLDPSSKSQNESDTQKLAGSSPSIAEAVAGLELLHSWKSDEKTVEAYREAAAKKWPQATVFQK
jgi:peptide alpha-N-acetyltransferase